MGPGTDLVPTWYRPGTIPKTCRIWRILSLFRARFQGLPPTTSPIAGAGLN